MNQQAVPRTISLGDDEQRVVFGLDDLRRHTMIFGSSGSGKTTRAFNPMLAEMIGRLGAGAFIIATKAEAVAEAVEIARRGGREATVVQPGGATGLDLLGGDPESDAASFRDAFGRIGSEAKPSVDAAVTRMKNALRMLLSAGVAYYTLDHLTNYCFDDTFAAMVRIQSMERLRALDNGADEAWTIREAIAYEDTRYSQFTADARGAVQFALAQLLEPLRDAAIAKTFASRSDPALLSSVFDGNVVVLHVPRAPFERAAPSIYTLAKRRFFTALERRRDDASLDQERPVVFAFDDYALCISESDIRSLGIVRTAGCMALGTTLGVSSLYSVLPEHQVDAALQNFTQKIFFKTDDDGTLALIDRATKHNAKIERSELYSMTRDQALCHVTVGDDSVDAILTMEPLFIAPVLGE